MDLEKKKKLGSKVERSVMKLLRKYKYPPEKVDGDINIVIEQAEIMSAAI